MTFNNSTDWIMQFCVNLSCPPYTYCEAEDGLIYAKNGRSRAIVSSGRGIALHVRALPLSNQIHSCLTNKSFQEACSEELRRKLAKQALNMKNLDAPEEIFKKTAGLDLSASIDKNGNAIIESEGLNNGPLCVSRVLCADRKSQRKCSFQKQGSQSSQTDNESKEEKAGENDAPIKETNIAKEDYEDIIKRK